jgi:hypothetical protein
MPQPSAFAALSLGLGLLGSVVAQSVPDITDYNSYLAYLVEHGKVSPPPHATGHALHLWTLDHCILFDLRDETDPDIPRYACFWIFEGSLS